MNDQNWNQKGEHHAPETDLTQIKLKFQNALKHWPELSSKSRAYLRKEALKYKDKIEDVKLILAQPEET